MVIYQKQYNTERMISIKSYNQVFEELYLSHYKRIYTFLYKLCTNQDLAEELTQETFLKAFKGFSKFKGKSSIFVWLASIAKFTYYTYMRKHKLDSSFICLDETVNLYCMNQYDEHLNEQLKDEVYKATSELINELPKKYRDVVMMRIYAEMSFKEVGETLNISENSAKVIYFRAKNKLKERIQHEFEL